METIAIAIFMLVALMVIKHADKKYVEIKESDEIELILHSNHLQKKINGKNKTINTLTNWYEDCEIWVDKLKKQHIEDLHKQRMEMLDSFYNDDDWIVNKIKGKLLDDKKIWGWLKKVSLKTWLSYWAVYKQATEDIWMWNRTIRVLKKYYNL